MYDMMDVIEYFWKKRKLFPDIEQTFKKNKMITIQITQRNVLEYIYSLFTT